MQVSCLCCTSYSSLQPCNSLSCFLSQIYCRIQILGLPPNNCLRNLSSSARRSVLVLRRSLGRPRGRGQQQESTESKGDIKKKQRADIDKHRLHQQHLDAEEISRANGVLPVVGDSEEDDVSAGSVLCSESPTRLYMMAISLKLSIAMSNESLTSRENTCRRSQLDLTDLHGSRLTEKHYFVT